MDYQSRACYAIDVLAIRADSGLPPPSARAIVREFRVGLSTAARLRDFAFRKYKEHYNITKR